MTLYQGHVAGKGNRRHRDTTCAPTLIPKTVYKMVFLSHLCLLLLTFLTPLQTHAFTSPIHPQSQIAIRSKRPTRLFSQDDERVRIEEESRIKVLSDRRKTIRGVLKAADGTRRFRIDKGE